MKHFEVALACQQDHTLFCSFEDDVSVCSNPVKTAVVVETNTKTKKYEYAVAGVHVTSSTTSIPFICVGKYVPYKGRLVCKNINNEMLYAYDINEKSRSTSLLRAPVACRLFMFATQSQLATFSDEVNEIELMPDGLTAIKNQNITTVYSAEFPFIDANHKLSSTQLVTDEEALDVYSTVINKINVSQTNGISLRSVPKLSLKQVLHADLDSLLSALAKLKVLSNQTLTNLHVNVSSDKLKLFVAVHNSLTLLSTTSSIDIQQLNSLHANVRKNASSLQDLHNMHLTLWQSLIVNETASGMYDYLNKSMFQADMTSAFAMFKDTSTYNIETSSSVFTQDKLYSNYCSRKPVSSAKLVKQLSKLGSPYWQTNDDNIFTTDDTTIQLVDTAESVVGNNRYTQTSNTLGIFLGKLLDLQEADRIEAFPMCISSVKLGIRNQIALSVSDLLQGQIISYTSTYGTVIDLLVKNFVDLQCSEPDPDVKAMTTSMINEMPRLVVETARIISTNLFKSKQINLRDATSIPTSCPGFLFGLNFGKNVIGIHADCIFTIDKTLYVGELKTKWTQPLQNSTVELSSAILFDHLHQCLCQAIVAYCMYGQTDWEVCAELFILSVPFKQRVFKTVVQTHTATLDDAGVAKLTCTLYARMLYHFYTNSNSSFTAFVDSAYYVEQSSQIMLWVIACLISECKLQCILLSGDDFLTLPQPTFARICNQTEIIDMLPNSPEKIDFTYEDKKHALLKLYTDNDKYQWVFCCTDKKVQPALKACVIVAIAQVLEGVDVNKDNTKFIYPKSRGVVLVTVETTQTNTVTFRAFPKHLHLILMLTQDTFTYHGIFLIWDKANKRYTNGETVNWFCDLNDDTDLSKSSRLQKTSLPLSLTHIDSQVKFYQNRIIQIIPFELSATAWTNICHLRWFLAYYLGQVPTTGKKGSKVQKLLKSWLYNYVENNKAYRTSTKKIDIRSVPTQANMPTSVLVPTYARGTCVYCIFDFFEYSKTFSTYTKRTGKSPKFFKETSQNATEDKNYAAIYTERSDDFLEYIFALFPKLRLSKPTFMFEEKKKAYSLTYNTVENPRFSKSSLNYNPSEDLQFVRTNYLKLTHKVENVEKIKFHPWTTYTT